MQQTQKEHPVALQLATYGPWIPGFSGKWHAHA